jgi:hypothetical protein
LISFHAHILNGTPPERTGVTAPDFKSPKSAARRNIQAAPIKDFDFARLCVAWNIAHRLQTTTLEQLQKKFDRRKKHTLQRKANGPPFFQIV